tara:strand:- start:17106 stop:17405 length:300 start_codon:yes stop_codon:yes gene_type:complete
MIYLVNKDNPAAISLAIKFSKTDLKPGSMIPCSKEEIGCYGTAQFMPISLDALTEKLVQVDFGKSYILFADDTVNIDDAADTAEVLNIELGIIRLDGRT